MRPVAVGLGSRIGGAGADGGGTRGAPGTVPEPEAEASQSLSLPEPQQCPQQHDCTPGNLRPYGLAGVRRFPPPEAPSASALTSAPFKTRP